MFKYEWVWDNHIPRNFINAKIMPMQRHENILVFYKSPNKYNPQMTLRDKPVKVKNYSKKKESVYQLNQDGSSRKEYIYTHRNPDTIIRDCWEANKGKVHPTQKPVSLMEYIINTYTDKEDTVLDFAMGSGSTGVASKKLNRNFIGIEINKEYFEIAKNRIEKY
jgi:site-specific DNA-methyltransferase (adenine-specific)